PTRNVLFPCAPRMATRCSYYGPSGEPCLAMLRRLHGSRSGVAQTIAQDQTKAAISSYHRHRPSLKFAALTDEGAPCAEAGGAGSATKSCPICDGSEVSSFISYPIDFI